MKPLGSQVQSSQARRSRRPGLDYTLVVRHIAEHLVKTTPDFSHVDLTRVAFSFSRTRGRGQYGIFASLTPLRFENGAPTGRRRGKLYQVQKLVDHVGQEMLYILSVYLPRFADLPLREKVITLFHEMWHISASFDGDIRRHPGRCYAHSHSKAEYDEQMGHYADLWLATSPPTEFLQILDCSFDVLHQRHGRLFGTRIPRPKLIPWDGKSLVR